MKAIVKEDQEIFAIELVEKWIRKVITQSEYCVSSTDKINQIAMEHFSSGGKRLRVYLALTVGKVFDVDLDNLIPWAAACEILHNATLVHDDIQDGDRFRRGKPTVWVTHGVSEAISLGDLLFMLPFKSIEGIKASDQMKWLLSKNLASQTENIVRGQSLEFSMLNDLPHLLAEDRLLSHYQICVKKKTSALFELPVFGSALMSGLLESEALKVSKVFEDLGLMFQIQDDLVDIWGEKGRSEKGSDIKEGKVSALVVEYLTLNPKELSWVQGILKTPRDQTTDEMVQDMIFKFEKQGARDLALKRLCHLRDNLFKNLYFTENQSLFQIAQDLADRLLIPIRHLL